MKKYIITEVDHAWAFENRNALMLIFKFQNDKFNVIKIYDKKECK